MHVTSRSIGMCVLLFLLTGMAGVPAAIAQEQPQEPERGRGQDKSIELARESLEGLQLPHGITLLPRKSSQDKYAFRFADGKLETDPFEENKKSPFSVEQYLNAMRQLPVDVCYLQFSQGSFIVFSGRISDTGEHLLHELNDQELPRPEKVAMVLDEDPFPGAFADVQSGHCYLVETCDGKYALVRLLAASARGALIQWVYQPDGSRKFAIPATDMVQPGSREEKVPDHEDKPSEDLSKCRLPHGEAILAKEYSAKSSHLGGAFFKFGDQKYHFSPFRQKGEVPESPAALLKALRKQHTGDVFYFPHKGGGLVSICGRIADLGEHFLWEFDQKQLPRPETGNYLEEDGDAGPGVITPVETGRCYLIETVDGKFALVRIVSVGKLSAAVQYVYQPDGTRVFSVPQGELILPEKPPATSIDQKPGNGGAKAEAHKVAKSTDPIDTRGVEEATEAHLANRRKLIDMLLNLVKEITGKDSRQLAPEQVKTIGTAIRTLGMLRASEATDILLDNIAFRDWTKPTPELGLPDSAAALVSIGKPATRAILGRLKSAAGGKDEPALHLEGTRELFLYSVVLSRVDGGVVAKFLLESEMQKVEEKNRSVYRKVLQYVRD